MSWITLIYENARCRLVMSCHASVIYRYGTHSCIIEMHYTMHVFARKQCILCSALRHKSYLTLPYVTLLRDSFCCPLARLLVGNKQAQLCRKWLFTFFYKYLQHDYSKLSIRQTPRKSRHLGMLPSFLQCCTLTFCKADISPRRTLMLVQFQWCPSRRDWLIVLIFPIDDHFP